MVEFFRGAICYFCAIDHRKSSKSLRAADMRFDAKASLQLLMHQSRTRFKHSLDFHHYLFLTSILMRMM